MMIYCNPLKCYEYTNIIADAEPVLWTRQATQPFDAALADFRCFMPESARTVES
jgi:hypothetical protein